MRYLRLIFFSALLVISAACSRTELLICGSSSLYRVDARKALKCGSYEDALLWSWDAAEHSEQLGVPVQSCVRLDECKPVDGGKQILVTSSADWAALIDGRSGDVIFSTYESVMAHSAEMLPGGFIAVACSTRGDCIQLYDSRRSGEVLFSTPLVSAHGLVWSERYQRLYAVGGNLFNTYRFTVSGDGYPSLVLESSVESPIVRNIHDLTSVDDDTLLLAGRKACTYSITSDTFEEIPMFSDSRSVKALNLHPRKGVWFVDASYSEGEPWSSKTARWTDDLSDVDLHDSKEPVPGHTFRVGDIDMYKIRVVRW